MAEALVEKWREYTRNLPPAYWFRDLLLEPCPKRLMGSILGEVPSTQPPPEKLMARAHTLFGHTVARYMKEVLPSFVHCADPLLDLETSYLGYYGDKNVCLFLTPVGTIPERGDNETAARREANIKKALRHYANHFSVRWELATIALLTRRNRFMLIVTGADTQRTAITVECSIAPVTDAASLAIEAPAVNNRSCRTCGLKDSCPEGERLAEFPLSIPPKLRVLEGASGLSGKSMLTRPANPIEMLLREMVLPTGNRKPGFHPSTMGREMEEDHPCLRVLYYEGVGAPQDPKADWLGLVFNLGHAWHEVIQDIAEKVDPNVEIEKAVRAGRMTGRLDLRTGDLICDIKSASAEGSKRGHSGQVHCYAWGEAQSGRPAERLAILTVLKGHGTIRAKEFRVDPAMLAKVEEMVYRAEACVDKGEVPDRYEGAGSKEYRCRDCNFYTHCWKDDK